MPKAKPDVVYIHRIEAGEWERQNILKPVADLNQTVKTMKTASYVVIGGATASAVWVAWVLGKKFIGFTETAGELFDAGLLGFKLSNPLGWSQLIQENFWDKIL